MAESLNEKVEEDCIKFQNGDVRIEAAPKTEEEAAAPEGGEEATPKPLPPVLDGLNMLSNCNRLFEEEYWGSIDKWGSES